MNGELDADLIINYVDFKNALEYPEFKVIYDKLPAHMKK
jgi:hypothetical protein